MSTASALGKGSDGPARWSLRLFGGFELGVFPGGERVASMGKRERLLLAYLALTPNSRQPRRKLTTLLWGDAADETTLENLRNCLWGLRKALGDTGHRFIASEGEDIVLDTAAFDVDTLAFRRLAALSGRSELEAAANLYSGEFLDGLDIDSEEFESWRRAEAGRYRDQAIDVLNRLMTQLSDCGETERVIETGERILGLEPFHEPAVRRLMRIYGESGRRAAAIQLYRKLADALKTELDAQPEAETRMVFAELASGEEWTSAPAAPGAKSPTYSSGMVATTDAPGDISIAVLPFTNMSGDVGHEFFSDGITEEITTALAKVQGLIVIGRTSAFQFKGQSKDLRAIGQALHARHLIEGAVRKTGNRVRISAQLIDAKSGTYLWAESYDRELTDIFAVQEDIARAIAGALRVPLRLKEGRNLVFNRTSDIVSYQDYLRARALLRGRGTLEPGGPLTEAANLLEQVVASDPNYAPAWGLLGQAYALAPAFTAALVNGSTDELRLIAGRSLQKAEAAAQQATRLDPNNIDGYTAQGLANRFRGRFIQAEDLFKQALSIDPGNPDALHECGLTLAIVGRSMDSLAIRLHLRAQEPLVPIFNQITATVLWENGQNDEAIAILKASPPTFVSRLYLARVYASMGRYNEAADALLDIPSGIYLPETVEKAIRLLRTAPAQAASQQTTLSAGALGFVYLYVDAPDRVLDFFEGLVEAGVPALGNLASFLWAPTYAPVRRTKRFKAYAHKAGMVDYWRARGWPDLCRPVGVDDFVCD